MIRAMAKAAALGAFGRLPGGAHVYRELTRKHLGTQATHVDKLARVWPNYVKVWTERCGLELEGLTIWTHEGGWTPFPFFAAYLYTRNAGIVTNFDARLQDRYLARGVNGALSLGVGTQERRDAIEALRWSDTALNAIESIGGKYIHGNSAAEIPIESESVDLCHTGGVLEHYRPEVLREFVREQHQILQPGGVASHVFDHRDHLFHADPKLPFLNHLAYSHATYSALFGHKLLYHNRLLPAEIITIFEEAGFELICLRRKILPHDVYTDGPDVMQGSPGLPRNRLAKCHRNATDEDLRTAAGHYLFRKPNRKDG